jgi:hypothetical protein
MAASDALNNQLFHKGVHIDKYTSRQPRYGLVNTYTARYDTGVLHTIVTTSLREMKRQINSELSDGWIANEGLLSRGQDE